MFPNFCVHEYVRSLQATRNFVINLKVLVGGGTDSCTGMTELYHKVD